MDFNEIGLTQAGFEGFRTVTDLLDARLRREIPAGSGVYVVTYTGEQPPEFLQTSTGGWFKGNDPTLELEELQARWVKRARVVYIGRPATGRVPACERAFGRSFVTAQVTTSGMPVAGHSGSSRRQATLWCVGATIRLSEIWPDTSG